MKRTLEFCGRRRQEIKGALFGRVVKPSVIFGFERKENLVFEKGCLRNICDIKRNEKITCVVVCQVQLNVND